MPRAPLSRISANVIFWGWSDIAHNLTDRGEGASTELRLAYSRFCRRQLQNLDCFTRNFSSPRWVGVTSLWPPLSDVGRTVATNISRSTFLHLPVIPNRLIARMTDIAFHCSPPRGVGMLRLVSSSAISRYGNSHMVSRMGFNSASRAAVASETIL